MADPSTTSVSARRARAGLWPGPARRTAVLAIGDAVVFLVFAVVGRESHGEATGLAAPLSVVGTAAPFAMAWFAIAPFVGAFSPMRTATTRGMLGRTELAWLCAWPLAMLLRLIGDAIGSVPLVPGFLAFAAVVLVTNALLLGVWRGLFSLASTRLGWRGSGG
jgi:hypothetical protein